MRVGFVGLGAIGAPMAERILSAGHSLTVWNRTPAKAAPFAARGAPVADSPAALAEGQDVVCLCVTDAAALEAVLFGAGGIAKATTPPRVIADHSTIAPAAATALAERIKRETGAGFIDAPVSGGIAGAKTGKLALFGGGKAQDFEQARPVFASFAATVTHLGPAGSGQIAKACNQIIGFLSFAAVAEAFALAEKSGIAPHQLAPALAGGFADTPVLREWRRARADTAPLIGPALHVEAIRAFHTQTAGPDYNGSSPQNLIKDLAIIGGLASGAGCPCHRSTPCAA